MLQCDIKMINCSSYVTIEYVRKLNAPLQEH